MNALPKIELPPLGHPDVIRVLEELLVEARAGRLVGVGVVAVGDKGQMNAITAGAAALPVVYTGAGLLQQQVMTQMTSKRSPILRPA